MRFSVAVVVWLESLDDFFVVSLKLRSTEANWDASDTSGILTVTGKNILMEYHSINVTQIENAKAACTNDHAIQNSRAMFSCIKLSIKGNLKDTIFSQFDNLPNHEDGIALFKLLTTFTTVALSQLSTISFQNTLRFNPHNFNYSIPTINAKLLHLFVLSSTHTCTLLDEDKV